MEYSNWTSSLIYPGEEEPWVRVSASYFHPSTRGSISELESALGVPIDRGELYHFDLADALIEETEWNRRTEAFQAFSAKAATGARRVTRIVGNRSSAEEGLLRITLTIEGPLAARGVSFPSWFLAEFFSQPGELHVN